MWPEKLNAKRQGLITSRLSIMEKMGTFLDDTINIMPKCAMHLHDHHNKMVPFMKPSIFVDFNNGVKFCSCICWLTNDIRNHCFSHWVSNHHINNKDLVLLGHVNIGL